MTLLDFLLGDRAGSYLLLSCLLVTTLAIITAIIDIPVRSLREAGLATGDHRARSLPSGLVWSAGITALLVTWLGASVQAYSAGAPIGEPTLAGAVLVATNLGLLFSVGIWGLTGPLMRHWGLCLGCFGFSFATFFLILAGILQLDFRPAETLPGGWQRPIFAGMIGLILLSITACLASILALVTHVLRDATLLAREHHLHREHVSFAISAKLARPSRTSVDEPTPPPPPGTRIATSESGSQRRSPTIDDDPRGEQRA